MDVNGQRFWMLSRQHEWLRDENLDYDPIRRCLRLASQRLLEELPVEEGNESSATALLHQIPQTIDEIGTRAFWDGSRIVATGAIPGSVPIYDTDSELAPTDLALGHDGILYIVLDGAVELKDTRARFQPVRVTLEDFSPWRLATHPEGGVWVLDRASRRLAQLEGRPFADRPFAEYRSFRPSPENPNPPKMTWISDAVWSAGEDPVAIASSPDGRLAVLNWVTVGSANISILGEHGWSERIQLIGATRPYSLAWLDQHRIAVLISGATEALVYELPSHSDSENEIRPQGDFYPLRDHNGGPFLNGVTVPPHYPTETAASPLHRVSLPSFSKAGVAFSATRSAGNSVQQLPLDGGSTQMVWHRVFLEAAVPSGCGIRLFLAASNSREANVEDVDWHEHRVGATYESLRDGVPRAVWMNSSSEIPFHKGLVPCSAVPNRTGLFSVLVQRANRPVRSLRGRYLHVRIELEGNNRSTPEVWAFRVYGSRFSYRDRYLPEIYREQVFGPDANRVIPTEARSTPADFLDRMLGNFEGVLTLLEDRVAQSWLLTDASSTPDDALGWLSSWIGMTLDSSQPAERQRQMLINSPQLCRQRGTLDGLRRALNIATGNGVDNRSIVLVEDFRLRRTVATILGVDLADELDPLLAGLAVSGNSYVGDTLLLGDETKGEFLALFGPDASNEETDEEENIDRFFDQLANRLTILVHDSIRNDLSIIRNIVELEAPAHVATRILAATHPLLVGMSSLVGVDTYTTDQNPIRPVQVEGSHVGLGDRIFNPATLDPRVGGIGYVPMVADAGTDQTIPLGDSFLLDGSGSRGTDGNEIIEFNWRLNGEIDDS